MRRSDLIKLLLVLLVLVVLRLPGVSLPYHQDEWKTVMWVGASDGATSGLYHPPLTHLLYRGGYGLFGPDHLRYLPLLFFAVATWLLWLVVRRRLGQSAAWWSVALWGVSFFGLWASLQIDTDGAILPAFLLLAVYAYDHTDQSSRYRWWWLSLLVVALLAGLLVKLSFVLVVAAVATDWLMANRQLLTRRRLTVFLFGLTGLAAVFGLLIALVHWWYPAFSVSGMIAHARSFIHFGQRNYLQVVAEGLKAVMYLSPLLLLPLLWFERQFWSVTRIFWLYLGFGCLFYFVAFDFSHGALDKYLVFMVLPLVVLNGTVFANLLGSANFRSRLVWGSGLMLAGGLLVLNFIPQQLLPLYPKSVWFSKVFHGHWSFLTPFTGGSGPVGFYVSFLFICLAFILTAFLIGLGLYQKAWRAMLLLPILLIGLTYNGVFIEELLWGKINGNAAMVLHSAVSFIDQQKNIKQVITYNDIGAYELKRLGKYAGRFYAAPQYEAGHRRLFGEFTGYYAVIEIPVIYRDSFYHQFFSSCTSLFATTSGKITASVYDCNK